MASLDDLPAELVLQIIIATRSVRAVACFGAASRFCYALATDDLLWRAFYVDRFGLPADRTRLLQADRTWRWLYRACVPTANLAGAAVGTISTNDGTYSGDLLDGRPHGRGMAIYPEGGLFDQPARLTRPGHVPLKRQRTLPINHWSEKLPPCDPWLYVGDWASGERTGIGAGEWRNGDRYQGRWHMDRRCGRGRGTWQSGHIYDGDWQHGRPHGQGTMATPDGDRYEGYWAFGAPCGRGSYRCADGRLVIGFWDTGRCLPETIVTPAGVATFDGAERHRVDRTIMTVVCNDGTRIRAVHRCEYDDGTCFCLNPDGSFYSGRYLQGEAHGHGALTLTGGRRYDGQWDANRRHGYGSMLYADGSRWEGEWRADRRHSGSAVIHGQSSRATDGVCACAACLPDDQDAWPSTTAMPLGSHARGFLSQLLLRARFYETNDP
ncbi:Morn repeat domain containing protein [Pandoravirus neocaledonia]|uniref:Morn repeat domain containing protein n=1 Tax=Pandoravirus neocaledonia TaxID=2107708 RepID=A0A2U7UC84_9VIRU|nr:Morn repeat domain containing protein [Pandoravirus neocaledonia]AVK76078.1 Morn repeat domain containing protein [Pandoravirus neocaledonia]